MKLLKAFVHRNRVPAILQALADHGFHRLSVLDARGTLSAVRPEEEELGLAAGTPLIQETQIEVVCDDARVDEAIAQFDLHARIGVATAGWIYVSDVVHLHRIGGTEQ
jgi:nitrogen regulatory protein PII